MITEAIRNFLETPRVAYLSTIDLQGYPHSVPVWFALDGDEIVSSGVKSRARARHILVNPKGAITIGGNMGDAEGYLIKGIFKIEEDSTHALRNLIIGRYVQGEALEQFLARMDAVPEERIIFRLTPAKVIKVR
jgi:predicted pyridoxine 5'-phosphate oxidase superfamily flavin-nucleotide-binding protein